MPKRIPRESVVVFRNGRRVRPKLGEPFDFTSVEVKEIESHRPNALAKMEREDEVIPEPARPAMRREAEDDDGAKVEGAATSVAQPGPDVVESKAGKDTKDDKADSKPAPTKPSANKAKPAADDDDGL